MSEYERIAINRFIRKFGDQRNTWSLIRRLCHRIANAVPNLKRHCSAITLIVLQLRSAGVSFKPWSLLSIFKVVAQSRLARGVMHVRGMCRAQRLIHGITIGIFKWHQHKMGIRIVFESFSRPQGSHDTRCFIAVLGAANENGGQLAV